MSRRQRPKPTQGGHQPPATREAAAPSSDAVSFNQGKVIMHLARTTYTTLIQVIAEAVQNALDAHASYIWIVVDERKRSIVVADNGAGVTPQQFAEALRSIGQGVKDPGSIGRFGLGLISPLDKCERFTFTSREPGKPTGHSWRFKASTMEVMSSNLSIPRSQVQWKTDDEFNTIMRIFDYTLDTQTASMTAGRVEEFVQSKLGPMLRKQNVTCKLLFRAEDGSEVTKEIKPTDFTGEPFAVYTYQDDDAGEIEFELYRAPRTTQGRQGVVMFSEMDSLYPITWPEFRRQAGSWLSDDTRKALGSGFFQGIIRAKKVELHPNRKKFVWNDAAKSLAMVVEEWYHEVGRQLYTDERVQEQETRLQRLGVQTLDRLKDLLKLDDSEHWRKIIESLREGTIGSGHADLPDEGETPEKGIREGQGGAGKPRHTKDPSEQEPRKRGPKGPERPGDKPGVSWGPEGQHRKRVHDSSTGISICHETLPGSDRLWEIEVESATIFINVRHPVFLMVEHADTFILQLQEWIILQAISLLVFPEDSRELLHDYSDTYAREYVTLSILGSMKRRRGAS